MENNLGKHEDDPWQLCITLPVPTRGVPDTTLGMKYMAPN